MSCYNDSNDAFFHLSHVTSSSKTANHCIQFALSDPKESALQQKCDHAHNEFCQSREQLKSIIHEVGEKIKQLCHDDDDLLYVYSQAVQGVENWKSYLLRSAQQDKARTEMQDSNGRRQISPDYPGLGYEIPATKVYRAPERLVWKKRNFLAHFCGCTNA